MKGLKIFMAILLTASALALASLAYDTTSLIDKQVYRLSIGETLELNVDKPNVKYSADNECVTVDEKGVITAKAAGKATVKATMGTKEDSITVHVLENPISPVRIYEKSAKTPSSHKKPTISFLGDSITAGSKTDYRYYQFIADKYGIYADGQGLSGSNIGGTGSSGQPSFIERVAKISARTDMIFVFGGINDFGQNAGNFERFQTGVRALIETLIDRFPDKPIVFSSPLRNGGYFSTSKNNYGNTLDEFVDEMEIACKEYNIPYFDSFRAEDLKDFLLYDEEGNYISKTDFQNPEYYGDGVHPNRAGHRVLSEWFIKAMRELNVIVINNEEIKVEEKEDEKPDEQEQTEEVADTWQFKYTDVDSANKYYAAIDFAGRNGIMNGVSETEFAPDLALNRAMFVTILHRVEGKPVIDMQNFNDVKSEAYYAGAAAWANYNNIVNGIAPGVFDPDTSITREQMATVIYRYLKYKGNVADETMIKTDFNVDLSDVSDWAKEAVEYCISNSIIEPRGTGFDPKTPATRAEAAYAIMQIHPKN